MGYDGRLSDACPAESGGGVELDVEESSKGGLESGGGGWDRPKPAQVVDMGGMEPKESGVAVVGGGCV